MSAETEEEAKRGQGLPPGYKALGEPPDGVAPSTWGKQLRREAKDQERVRFVDETLSGYFKDEPWKRAGERRDRDLDRS